MKVVPFIADSAAEAVEQIRAQLGPEAMVLNLRPLPREGMARLWQRPRIEVLACAPESPPSASVFAELRQEIAELKRVVESRPAPVQELPDTKGKAPEDWRTPCLDGPPHETWLHTQPSFVNQPEAAHGGLGSPTLDAHWSQEHDAGRARLSQRAESVGSALDGALGQTRPTSAAVSNGAWSVGPLLESLGVLPLCAQRVVERLQLRHGAQPPASLADELSLLRTVLVELWKRPLPAPEEPGVERHVFIGPAGVGKTTCLCKWLAQSVLLGGRAAAVWRLDSRTANTAESLNVYGEILGVPVERSWGRAAECDGLDLAFIDLPGVDWREETAVRDLGARLADFAPAQAHLVLNAAYEVPLLLAQARAFAALPVTDLIFTHLDEEPRRGKLWNFVLGTNYTLRFLSAGQNIPGEFRPATPEIFLGPFFPCK